MNTNFAAFIETSKSIAKNKGLKWDIGYDNLGVVDVPCRWNISKLLNVMPPPLYQINNVGFDRNGLSALNTLYADRGLSLVDVSAMQPSWIDLYLAVIIDQLFVKKTKPDGAINATSRWVRLFAACAVGCEPWEIEPEQIQFGYNAALMLGASGQLARTYRAAVRAVFDTPMIADHVMLGIHCVPFADERSQRAQRTVEDLSIRVNTHHNVPRLRTMINERKDVQKLPEANAFWELVRIIYTETPQTVSDAIRFGVLKIAIVTGMRVGELVTIPADWMRWREYVDHNGDSAGAKGGIARSLMIKHFAEKQADTQNGNSVVLYETAQHVPPIFEEEVISILSDISNITAPLRKRLEKQTETGRIFPEFGPHDLVPSYEMFVRASGSIIYSNAVVPQTLIDEYRATYNPTVLSRIWDFQECNRSTAKLTPALKYWQRPVKAGHLNRYDATGGPARFGTSIHDVYLRVDEVEQFIRTHAPTKISDIAPASLSSGQPFWPHELLFLLPIRGLIEGREDGIIDLNRYCAIGRLPASDIQNALGGKEKNLFQRYGETDVDRQLSLTPHVFRHLQTTELFRLGVADAIITKRFNRTSVAQSYTYDHRSLAEELYSLEIPVEAEEVLGPNAQSVARMILSGHVTGPVVDEFREIQNSLGDAAAFEFLAAEADGLHGTPFGFCVNSFTVDPCPSYLQCFKGCRHLARTGRESEKASLKELEERFLKIIEAIVMVPESRRTIGWRNQLANAETLLTAVRTALNTAAGERPFPDGADLYEPADDRAGTSIIDRAKRK